VIDGLTGDQRFFLSYAQSWRHKSTDESIRQQIVANSHAPANYRVNGVVRNMDAWYEAFGIKQGDRLYLAPDGCGFGERGRTRFSRLISDRNRH
jgi:putative endopeptidase